MSTSSTQIKGVWSIRPWVTVDVKSNSPCVSQGNTWLLVGESSNLSEVTYSFFSGTLQLISLQLPQMYHFWETYTYSHVHLKSKLVSQDLHLIYSVCQIKCPAFEENAEWMVLFLCNLYSSGKYPLTSPIKDIFSKTPTVTKKTTKMGHISCKNHLKMITFKTQSINLVCCDSYVDPQRSLKIIESFKSFQWDPTGY